MTRSLLILLPIFSTWTRLYGLDPVTVSHASIPTAVDWIFLWEPDQWLPVGGSRSFSCPRISFHGVVQGSLGVRGFSQIHAPQWLLDSVLSCEWWGKWAHLWASPGWWAGGGSVPTKTAEACKDTRCHCLELPRCYFCLILLAKASPRPCEYGFQLTQRRSLSPKFLIPVPREPGCW